MFSTDATIASMMHGIIWGGIGLITLIVVSIVACRALK